MKYSRIVPAVIPADQSMLEQQARQLRFSREFHLDLVDGKFVPPVSWPYQPYGDPLVAKPLLDAYTLEVDLMVADPLTAAEAWVVAGADMLVFHIETIAPDAFRRFAAHTPVSVGVSCHGATTIEELLVYAADADYVQLMGIREIGAQGLPFDEAVLEKIATVKQQFPDLLVSVDGSVNADTIVRLREAGADRFIVGSAIVKQVDPEAAHRALDTLINE